jgi:hypothetical protein
MSESPTDPNCILCGEEAAHDNFVRLMGNLKADGTAEMRWVHDDCNLREVLGGIGHLVAHEYWCLQRHDPDAGLTYRQSALLVYHWTKIVGAQSTTDRDSITS